MKQLTKEETQKMLNVKNVVRDALIIKYVCRNCQEVKDGVLTRVTECGVFCNACGGILEEI